MSDAPAKKSFVEEPPHSWRGIAMRLGPGLIVAGSIVGSGELIATTKTGAEAGFWLLWLILIGCVIKVFAQVELGRYSIINGKTTMDGMAEVPGPRIQGRGNWLVWYWFFMFLASLAQLGGIVGSVGQALAISVPITQEGREFNEFVDLATEKQVKEKELERAKSIKAPADQLARLTLEASELSAKFQQRRASLLAELGPEEFEEHGQRPPPPRDDVIWAAVITAGTSVMLVMGRYGLIQSFSTTLVALFTLVTVVNLGALQANPTWAVSLNDIYDGMSFRLPPAVEGVAPLATALATFGIIGVGASELVTYPYWCMEKGYAKFTGPRDKTEEWGERARGWMRVMRCDAWCSMLIYTFATLAFYLLGAAILGRTGLNPEKKDLIRTLSVMYEPVFGAVAGPLFLFGAFAVLYSTFFVANASQARVCGDAVRVLGLAQEGDEAYRRRVRFLSGLFPFVCLFFYAMFPAPAALVLLSGIMQAVMLPMLAFAALYFRYYRGDARLRPSRLWDGLLAISAVGMFIAGTWSLVENVHKAIPKKESATSEQAVESPDAGVAPGQSGPPGN